MLGFVGTSYVGQKGTPYCAGRQEEKGKVKFRQEVGGARAVDDSRTVCRQHQMVGNFGKNTPTRVLIIS